MKNFKLVGFLCGILLLTAFGCGKEKPKPEDNIVFTPINRVITIGEIDSLNSNTFFEIISDLYNEYFAILREYIPPDIVGGNSCEYLLEDDSVSLQVLDFNHRIYSSGKWRGIGTDTLSLNLFAGLGEKYIGYRLDLFHVVGKSVYHYGWIKVELSEHRDTLRIISWAQNHTDNNPIRAGQVE